MLCLSLARFFICFLFLYSTIVYYKCADKIISEVIMLFLIWIILQIIIVLKYNKCISTTMIYLCTNSFLFIILASVFN